MKPDPMPELLAIGGIIVVGKYDGTIDSEGRKLGAELGMELGTKDGSIDGSNDGLELGN